MSKGFTGTTGAIVNGVPSQLTIIDGRVVAISPAPPKRKKRRRDRG